VGEEWCFGEGSTISLDHDDGNRLGRLWERGGRTGAHRLLGRTARGGGKAGGRKTVARRRSEVVAEDTKKLFLGRAVRLSKERG